MRISYVLDLDKTTRSQDLRSAVTRDGIYVMSLMYHVSEEECSFPIGGEDSPH